MHKEWDQGERKWEVELDGLQICLQASELAGGRFMLAADKASLGGRLLQPEQLNAIHLDVDKVRPNSAGWWVGRAGGRRGRGGSGGL